MKTVYVYISDVYCYGYSNEQREDTIMLQVEDLEHFESHFTAYKQKENMCVFDEKEWNRQQEQDTES